MLKKFLIVVAAMTMPSLAMAVRTRMLVAPAAKVAVVAAAQFVPPSVETSSAAVAPVSVPTVAVTLPRARLTAVAKSDARDSDTE